LIGAVATTDRLGKRIRDARLARKLGARKLAKQLGISLKHLHDIEAGRTRPSPQLTREIADSLGLETSELRGVGPAHDTPEHYLAENPFANVLFSRISEGRVADDELRRLADAAARLDASRAERHGATEDPNAEPSLAP
jgi:transcriptional regulator with XRE-family HTH domain